MIKTFPLPFISHLSGGFLLLHTSAYGCMNPHDPKWIAKHV
nr:MAG TPA: hypothetical protein [Caudoviricetes sp.]